MPPGAQIAYTGGTGVRLLVGKSKTRPLADGAHPAWSPDGNKIAFEQDQDDTSFETSDDLFVVNADGSALRRIANSPGTDNEPTWSPDGKSIAFTSARGDGPAEIWITTADGRKKRRVTHDARLDEDPAWSPDGKKIVFSSDGLLYVMSSRGTRRKLLMHRDANEPAWSPDGRKIVFESNGGIWVANADGTHARELLPHQPDSIDGDERLYYGEPDWSPDGRSIIFEATKRGNGWFSKSESWLLRSDGTGVGQVAIQGFAGYHKDPKWRPRNRGA